jgi:hypothetical protein
LILKVNYTKIQGSVLMVVHTAAELVDDTVICLTTMIRKVTRADHKVAVGAKLLINVVQFGAEHEGSLVRESALAVGKACAERWLTEDEPPEAEVRAARNALVPAVSVESVTGLRTALRVVKGGISIGFHESIEPIHVDLATATLDRGYHLGVTYIRQYGSRHDNCES